MASVIASPVIAPAQSNKRGTVWEYLHVAIDDASRLAYTELLPNDRKEGAIGFTRRAVAWFGRHGATIERLMSDSGSAYRSFAFRDMLAELHAADQRQGGKLHPDQSPRMGLCPSFPNLSRTRLRHAALDHRLQPQPTSLRSRRQASHLPHHPRWCPHPSLKPIPSHTSAGWPGSSLAQRPPKAAWA